MQIHAKLIYFFYGTTLYSTYTFAFQFLEKHWSFPLYASNYLSIFFLLCPLIATTVGAHVDKHPKRLLPLAIISILGFSIFFALMFIIRPPDRIMYRIIMVTIFYTISNLFGSITGPLLDAFIINLVKDPNKFGQERLWISVAHSFITILIGWLYDNVMGYCSMITCLGVNATILIVLLTVVMISFPEMGMIKARAKEQKEGEKKECKDEGDKRMTLELNHISFVREKEEEKEISDEIVNIQPLLSLPSSGNFTTTQEGNNNNNRKKKKNNRNLVLLCIAILIGGINRCVVGNLLSYRLTEKIKLSFLTTALALNIRIIPETLLFFYAYKITPLFGSHGLETNLLNQLSFGIFLGFSRSAIYCISNKRWISFGVELIKGCNHALIRDSISRLAKIKSHNDNSFGALSQTLMSLMYGDVAQAISGTMGGLILQFQRGQSQISTAFGIVTLLCLLAFLFIEILKRNSKD